MEKLLERPRAYRAWQAMFHRRKLEPLRRHNDVLAIRSVLELGCGPGMNVGVFPGARFVGIDVNPLYLAFARSRWEGDYRCQDVVSWSPVPGERFDCILLNSLLHHLKSEEAAGVLREARRAVAVGGAIHVIDMVRPEKPGLARWLANHDRGAHQRRWSEWKPLLEQCWRPVVIAHYAIRVAGLEAWRLFYFKGVADD